MFCVLELMNVVSNLLHRCQYLSLPNHRQLGGQLASKRRVRTEVCGGRLGLGRWRRRRRC